MIETPILSVSEISLSLKTCVEQVFAHVKVRGEISDVKRATSGHIYFSLKDKDAVLSAICWRGRAPATNQAIQEGLEVVCTGKLSTYPGRSNYQMIVETAEPAGIGALLKLLNERREKLAKEGLFDESHKQPIPFLPTTIGVITSPTGAVIRDIIHRLTDRFPRHVLVWPVAVQGTECAEQVAAAIKGFNDLPPNFPRPDVLIVARGGGSLEDLWGFNEECVVRAVYDSKIPVISAVGHETDTTLIDYVSDLRAPTPTGAAEKAVPLRSDLLRKTQDSGGRLRSGLVRFIQEKQLKIQSLVRALPNLTDIIPLFIQRLDDVSARMDRTFGYLMRQNLEKVSALGRLLNSYSYQNVLKRGFALVSAGKQILSSAVQTQDHSHLTLTFADGKVDVTPLKAKKTSSPCYTQADLFQK
ncbi:MAG: exodeoxyribonuclease VII large subunit [Alphaproteobacteria bacterium]|nr:exodeoxyribonuclease VII large subunit [Alphaproteobacteria bacterium]